MENRDPVSEDGRDRGSSGDKSQLPRQTPPANAPTGPRRPTCCQLHNLHPSCGLACNGVAVQATSSSASPSSPAHLHRPTLSSAAPHVGPPPAQTLYIARMSSQADGGLHQPRAMTPPRGPRNPHVVQRRTPTQNMPPHVPTQPRAYNMYPLPPMGYQQQGYSFDPTPAHLQQQFHQTYAPPDFQRPAPGQAAMPSATYRVAEPDEEEDLSGPLSLAGLRDVTFTQPAAGGSTPVAPDPSLDLSKTSPPKPWLADTRKDSHARFDLRLDDLEKGMIVHLKPNATWGTGRHPGLVIDWKDAGYVEILVGTSFLGQGMRSKMARIRETHEKVRIAREYLKIWDRTNQDHEPTYQSLDLPVLRLREGKYLKKTTYFRFVYRFHCELTDICKYGDGVSLHNKYILDAQSLEALYGYLNLRLPMIKEAEATVRRKQRVEAREAAKQKAQDEMKEKVAQAARALQARTP